MRVVSRKDMRKFNKLFLLQNGINLTLSLIYLCVLLGLCFFRDTLHNVNIFVWLQCIVFTLFIPLVSYDYIISRKQLIEYVKGWNYGSCPECSSELKFNSRHYNCLKCGYTGNISYDSKSTYDKIKLDITIDLYSYGVSEHRDNVISSIINK